MLSHGWTPPSHFLFSPSQLDFWLSPRGTGDPVDVRVPFPSLQPLKAHLEANGVPYSIMIKDVQVRCGGGSGGRGSRRGGGRGLSLPRVPPRRWWTTSRCRCFATTAGSSRSPLTPSTTAATTTWTR